MTNIRCCMCKLKNENWQNKKRLPHTFYFPEGQMHQNQSVCFHLNAIVLLKQYLR